MPLIITKPINHTKRGLDKLTDFQKAIIDECIEKKSGGLQVPMGSGKTLMSLVLGLIFSDNGKEPILIIASKTLLSGWIEEIHKWFGNTLKYEVVHSNFMDINDWEINPKTKIVLTTPQVLSKYYKMYEVDGKFTYWIRPEVFGPTIKGYKETSVPFCKYMSGGGYFFSTTWKVMIVDEAQEYTKITSDRSKAIACICAKHRWLLSGTMFQEPVPERILGFYLFINESTIPRNLPDFESYMYSYRFRGLESSLVIRRKNETFKPPEVNQQIVSHALSPEEALIYTTMKDTIKSINNELKEYKRWNDIENIKKFSSYLMAMITYLRQGLVCPLIPVASVSIDTSDFVCKSELSGTLMESINKLGIDDWLNDPDAMYSSRVRKTVEYINKHPDENILIFSCFVTSLHILKEYVPKDRPIFKLDSSMSVTKRGKIMEQFKQTRNGILLLTYEIGSNGLNLQCATVVMLLDVWWNACKTQQAIARMLRYGQKSKLVHVYYFTSNTGIEKCLFEKQLAKLTIVEELYKGQQQTSIPRAVTSEIIRLIDTNDNIELLKTITT